MSAGHPPMPTGLAGDSTPRRLAVAYLVSLVLHALLLVTLTGGWLTRPPLVDPAPVYYVDLVHKPVLNPQAGRPEPRAPAAPPAPAPAPPVAAAKVPEKAAVPGKTAPPASPTRPAASPADSQLAAAMQELRDRQALQERLAALRQGQAVAPEVPVGLPTGRGSEAGVPVLAYVQATIQQNWALSPYLLADSAKMARLEAWVLVTYSRQGRLEGFRFEKESGDRQFDESIKKALVKSQQLAQPLPERLDEVRVVFNLKAMAELR